MRTVSWRIAFGEADPFILNDELRAALGLVIPPRWAARHNAAELIVDLFDDSIQSSAVTAVFAAHVDPAAIAARAQAKADLAARLAQDETERLQVKGNAALNTFMNMSPADIDAWMTANVTTLAQARTALTMMAKLLNVACRRQLRNGN